MKTPTKLPIYPWQQHSAQNKPPHADGIGPRKCSNKRNPALRPIDEDSVPLGEPTGDTVPTMQPGAYPTPPTNQARMTAKTPAPSATRPPLRPTQPRPPRPHVDTQMRRHSAVDSESWWVHSGVAMLPPLIEFTYNSMYSSSKNKIYNPKFYLNMERQISTSPQNFCSIANFAVTPPILVF